MRHLKARLLAIVIILIFSGLMYYNWQQLLTTGSYSVKMAGFGPLGIIGGLFLLVFPDKAGKPTTTKDKVTLMIVFGVGLVAGLLNWYLMDPGFFGQ